jgi:signal transduction histidine kinase
VAEPTRTWPHTLRRRLGSVRLHAAVGAILVISIALVGSAAILTSSVRSQLYNTIRESARLRADDVATALNGGTAPGSLAVSDSEDLIQVVTADGAVIASSRNIRGMPPVSGLKPGETQTVKRLPIKSTHRGFIIVASGARVRGQGVRVLVARENDIAESSANLLEGRFAFGIPVLLLLVGATTYLLTGRALAPVEAIRRRVDEISGSALDRRVPEPKSSDEIGRLAVTMNRMLGRLEAAADTQRRFVSDASHELRSPVAVIRQHGEIALAHPERTTTRELAETVLAENLRVQHLVEDLLLLARTEGSASQHRWHPVDLDDFVLEEATRIRATSDLEIDMGSVSAARVVGDGAQLRRLVRNLIDNAMRHASHQIRLSLAVHGESVGLRVEDDGAGVADADRERIFERFVRLDEARSRDGGGSGLGLAIVKDLAVLHGGDVRVSRSTLGGASFDVTLPLDPADL